MSERQTTTAHHMDCPYNFAWDVASSDPLIYCSCPPLWPRKVCIHCWNMPHQHRRHCRLHPKAGTIGAQSNPEPSEKE
jgi:hypothetical protein